MHLSWAETEQAAEDIAVDQWRSNVIGPPLAWDTETAEAFDTIGEMVTVDAVREAVQVSSDLGEHRERLEHLASLGFDDVYLHHVGQEQSDFIDAFGSEVLPRVGSTAAGTASASTTTSATA